MTCQIPTAPRLSVIVIFHKMMREAKRTLQALSSACQTGVTEDQYEVIAVENGVQTLDPGWVGSHGAFFSYHLHETASVSPAAAVNAGVARAQSSYVALIIDGARIPTPGIVAATLAAMAGFHPCFVSALAWHLGPDVQRISARSGYDQAAEDRLLDSISWPSDGYRLFEIATLAPSSGCGLLNGFPAECSWLALPRARFTERGGYDEAFQSPGGGLVNHDFLQRLCNPNDLTPVQLLGEGTFHQIHGGAMTGEDDAARMMALFKAEYSALRGCSFVPAVVPDPVYLGRLPAPARQFVLN